MNDVIAVVLAYVVGAIPTGYWFCLSVFGIDITQHGSGNIGASNVARVIGLPYFVLIFLIDAAKAYGVLWLGGANLYFLAAALLLGNAYSIFLKFRGGRGVATTVGICAFLLPWQSTLLFMMIWSGVVGVTKKPFIASLGAIVGMTGVQWYVFHGSYCSFLVLVCAWLGMRHLSHVRSWLNGSCAMFR